MQGAVGRAAAAAAALLPRPPQRGVAWVIASQQQRTGWALEAVAGLAAASRQVGCSAFLSEFWRRWLSLRRQQLLVACQRNSCQAW